MITTCAVAVTFDEDEIYVQEMKVEGLRAEEVQDVASKLLAQIIPQVEGMAILTQIANVIERDRSLEAQSREEILNRLDELKQALAVRHPRWKAARELLAIVADIASVAPLVSHLQTLLPQLRL